MRISVRTRTTKRGLEPCSICVGRSCLPVVRVLACRELHEQRCYDLNVLDGRCFVIHHALHDDVWELEAVYAERQRPAAAAARRIAAALPAGAAMLELCLSALNWLLRKMKKAMRRAGKLRDRHDVVPA